ncbi:MAG: agmatine deiminase family protein [Acidobacteriota bacterium]
MLRTLTDCVHLPALPTLALIGVALIPALAAVAGPASAQPRVPAEWEPHAATWMQWPGPFEASMRPEFAEIIRVIQAYEPVHLIAGSASARNAAQAFLDARGVPADNLTWHVYPIDNSWLRDNGPIYVQDGSETRILNWGFDAWGGNFGADIPFASDDLIPFRIAEVLGLQAEDRRDYILEKGNLEFNGAGTLVLNWDCQDDRNPGLSQGEHEQILREAFGLDRIIWAYGHYPDDGTTGHIDGTARFLNAETIAIADYGSPIELDLAAACEAAGLEVVWYDGDPNWLVGNGFVAAMAAPNPAKNAELKALLESHFPGRTVHMVDARAIAQSGGGIHCVTNDQPAPAGEVFRDGFESGDTSRWSAESP